jgi:hypothetical protein
MMNLMSCRTVIEVAMQLCEADPECAVELSEKRPSLMTLDDLVSLATNPNVVLSDLPQRHKIITSQL